MALKFYGLIFFFIVP
jgi:hypothetical protein